MHFSSIDDKDSQDNQINISKEYFYFIQLFDCPFRIVRSTLIIPFYEPLID